MNIDYFAISAENAEFPDNSFDVVTAWQCFCYFDLTYHEEYDINVPFTRESWHGRMRACRGVGASLDEEQLKKWDEEHKALLEKIAPEKFNIRHYAAIAELKLK